METLKLKIHYEDRLGLVLDVSRVLLNYGLNITALQLMNNLMFMEIENHHPETWLDLKEHLMGVPSVRMVERISDMPYQSREKQIDAIINSITPVDEPADAFGEIIGNSSAFRAVINLAKQIDNPDSTVPCHCRVITATNRNIEEMVHKGLFRKIILPLPTYVLFA